MKKLYTLLTIVGFGFSVKGQDLTSTLIPEEGSSYSQGFNSYGYSTLYHPLLFKDGGLLNLSQSENRGHDSLSYVRIEDTISVRHHRPFSHFSSMTKKFLIEGDTAVKVMSVSAHDWDGSVGSEYEYKPSPILFSFPMSPGDVVSSSCNEYSFFEEQDSTFIPVSLTIQRTFVGYMDIVSDFGFYPNLIFVREDWIRDDISEVSKTNFFWLYESSGIFFPIFEMYEHSELNIGEYLYITEAIPSSGSLGEALSERSTEELHVYPNPVQEGFVQIIIPNNEENLAMYSSAGVLVKNFPKPRAGVLYYDISDLASGMYILQVGEISSKLAVY